MMRLLAPVGKDAPNHRADVAVVQALLHRVGAYWGRVDSLCGPKTKAAIVQFQSGFLKNPDGRVDPNGTTFKKLTGVIVTPAPTTPPTPPPSTDPVNPPSATPQRPSPSPTVYTDWTGDSARWPEDKKLASLHADLRPKVEAILASLKQQNFQPKVFYGWRSVAVQLDLFEKGNTTVKFSYHNAQKPDGTPNAYAADIVDSRWGWGDAAETNGFWTAMGKVAKEQGLTWGGDWTSFRDVAHVEIKGKSLADVKKESGL
jgi:peptidoglycan L-alanyl-D-glutamate endopeptidase CwlK